MSKRTGDKAISTEEPPDKCELCGRVDELRPYGPRGERICVICAMKNPATTERQMDRVLFGRIIN